MKPLTSFTLALIFGSISTALNPMSPVIAQEAEMSSPAESNINQQIDIQGDIEIQIENEIEIELEPEQSIIYTPAPMEENALD